MEADMQGSEVCGEEGDQETVAEQILRPAVAETPQQVLQGQETLTPSETSEGFSLLRT
jgi:hypothetical protein